MNKPLLIGLGVLGALFVMGQKEAGAAIMPLPTPQPKPKVKVSIGPAKIDSTGAVHLPSGWVAAMPTPDLKGVATNIANLGDPVGTQYPFQLDGKNFLAVVVPNPITGKNDVAILQPEGQV